MHKIRVNISRYDIPVYVGDFLVLRDRINLDLCLQESLTWQDRVSSIVGMTWNHVRLRHWDWREERQIDGKQRDIHVLSLELWETCKGRPVCSPAQLSKSLSQCSPSQFYKVVFVGKKVVPVSDLRHYERSHNFKSRHLWLFHKDLALWNHYCFMSTKDYSSDMWLKLFR